MKIAALSDIHGNLFALDAVLEDVRSRGVDITVNLGDILSGALLPAETAERLMALELPTIRGNHERQVLAGDPERMGPSDRHAFDTLDAAQRAWVAQLPAVLRPADGVFLCHATPHNDFDCYLEDLVDGELRPAPVGRVEERSRGCDASLILCGHSHIPRVIRLRTGQLVVNPGSVGQPRSGDARASYAVWDDGEFILRKARYPVETTIAKLKLLGFKETVEQELATTLRTGGS